MSENDLGIKELYKKAVDDSVEVLSSMTALEMCEQSKTIMKALDDVIEHLKVPASVIIGTLMCEILKVNDEIIPVPFLAYLEVYKKYIDEKFFELKHYIDTKDSLLKKYMEDNFIRKEG